MKLRLTKKEILLSIVWIGLVISVLFVGKNLFVSSVQEDYNDSSAEHFEVDIAETTISQSILIQDSVEKMSFMFQNASNANQAVLILLKDAKDMSVVQQAVLTVVPSNGENQIVEWIVGKSVALPEQAIIEIAATGVADSVSVCVQNQTFGNSYSENGEVKEAHIRMAIVYDIYYDIPAMGMYAVILIVLGLLFILNDLRKMKIENIFLIIALLTGISFAVITPLGQEPDGWAHFMRSVDVSYGNLLLPFVDNNGSSALLQLPENINSVGFQKIAPNTGSGIAYMNHIKELYFSDNSVILEGPGGFTSFFYLPQAIGLCVARLFHMSAYGHMLLGRLVNLFAYIALTYVGLKKMPILKNIYLVIALLPMTIFQAASFSYDALLNGFCFLFIGLCFYYTYEKESLSWKDVLPLGCILALLFLCKYIYVCIGLLVFTIPVKKFGNVKNYWKSFGIAIIPVIMIVAVMGSMLISYNTPAPSTDSTGVVETAQMTQLAFALQNPVHAIKVFINTFRMYFNLYLQTLNILGWLNYSLEFFETLVPIFAVAVAVLDTQNCVNKITTKNRILYFMTFVIVVVAGLAGLYLMDTTANPVGTSAILGYQGRYTIPVLMLLLATFVSGNVENKIKDFSLKVAGAMAVILTYSSILILYKCY